MLRLFVLILLIHVYMGWRLLPDMPLGVVGMVITGLLLATPLCVLPFAEYARRHKQNPCADQLAGAGFLAMGFFSSLLLLTLLRDVLLLTSFAASGWLIDPSTIGELRRWSAAAVPSMALVVTLVGFINARRRARIRTVDIPIDGLPVALHGFSIAQITDIHVGATIKRGYVTRIVD